MGLRFHIFVLIWKNFKMQFRHPWITAIELLLPVGFMVLLVLLHLATTVQVREIETAFEPYDINSLPTENFNTSNSILLYTPQTKFLDGLMESVSSYLNVPVRGFDSEKQLEDFYKSTPSKIVAGVVFSSSLRSGVPDSGPIEYTIRPENIPGVSWNLSYTIPSFPPFEVTDKSVYGTYYMTFGFLSVQHAIAKAILENIFNDWTEKFDEMFIVEMSRHPLPQFKFDTFYQLPEYYVMLAISIGYFFPSAMLAKNLVHERQTKLKKTLILMGLSNWENWTAWFIKEFIFMFLCSLIMTIMLSFGKYSVLNNSEEKWILLWLILYSCSIIAFTFFISTFFDKEYPAVSAILIINIVTFIPYIHSRALFYQAPYIGKIILCILPNTLFAYSVRVLLRLELLGKGLNWKTLFETEYLSVEISMNLVYIIFAADILIYVILTWYTEVIRCNVREEHHPWYFPFTFAYWTGEKDIPIDLPSHGYHFVDYDFIEADPPRVKPMINIINLTKVYGKNSQPIIYQVNLRAYKGRITVLLGHVGSGKSTFASMLYGAINPSSGRIIMKEYNLCEIDEVCQITPFLGICPDYNLNVEELNIQENLNFFCRIRGFEESEIDSQITKILNLFDLEIKKARLASTLSPGLLRRLSLGISLIGETEVVIIDEPTMQLDSTSRRLVWDILRLEKKDRAIFLTTSEIGEAYALADKIAVLHNGTIESCGSPVFLKKKYECGYLLTVAKGTNCNSAELKRVIKSHISGVIFVEETENELKSVLPPDTCHKYENLLKALEHESMNTKEIVIMETTLDELFKKMTNTSGSTKTEERKSEDENEQLKSLKRVKKGSTYHLLTNERNEGCSLFFQQINAVFRKKYLYSKRNIGLTLSQVFVLPLILVLSSLLKEKTLYYSKRIEDKSIFDLSAFQNTTVVYGIEPRSNITIYLGDTYASMFSETDTLHLVDLEEENYLTVLMQEAEKDLNFYKSKYIIGAEFDKMFNLTLITAFYNSDAYHSAPMSLLYVHNTILSLYSNRTDFSFKVNNNPLPFKSEIHKTLSTSFEFSDSFIWAQDITAGLAILMSSFVILLVIESSSKFKKQQFISGLNAFVYWFSSFMYDYVMYLIPCFLVIVVLVICETFCLHDFKEIGSTVLLLLLHGQSALLFIYCCTFLYRSASAAYISIFLYYFLGLICLVIVYSLELVNNYSVSEVINILCTVFMPSYCIVRGFYNIHRNCVNNLICNNLFVQNMCLHKNATSFVAASCCLDQCGNDCRFWSPHMSLSVSGIGKELIVLSIQPFIFILILILLEMEVFQALITYIKENRLHYYDDSLSSSDKDVVKEAERIQDTSLPQLVYEGNYLILENVLKIRHQFPIGKLTFGLKRGECLGLIGIDEAGKSTVLAMICGSTPMSKGSIYIDGYNIVKDRLKVLDLIGFSFGTYALLKQLTVRETLILFARIRGIPEKEVPLFIESLINILALPGGVHGKKYNKTNKKKLNVAISIIGTPPLILLEEPTTGVDQIASMNIFEAINEALRVGCTILLTSQNMNECESLCNRIGIMVEGKLTYIGDFDNLKLRYKDGFTLILRIQKSRKTRSRLTRQAITAKGNLEEIKGYIEEMLPEAIVKIELSTYLNYFVPQKLKAWSKIFKMLEQLKKQELIFSYSICQTNLEQIFIYNHHSDYKQKSIAEYLRERKRTGM